VFVVFGIGRVVFAGLTVRTGFGVVGRLPRFRFSCVGRPSRRGLIRVSFCLRDGRVAAGAVFTVEGVQVID